MSTINTLKYNTFDDALKLLNAELIRTDSPSYNLVICGGSALIAARLTEKRIGEKLTVNIISRIDQIYFKLYAAVDQFGGYHADDLEILKPADDELFLAAKWSMSHDPSDGYRQSIKTFLKEFGYGNVADRI